MELPFARPLFDEKREYMNIKTGYFIHGISSTGETKNVIWGETFPGCRRAVLAFCCLIVFLVVPAVGMAAKDAPKGIEKPTQAGDSAEIYRTLEQSFEKTIGIEKEKLTVLEERLAGTAGLKQEFEAAHEKYRTMLSTQSNLLLLPSVDYQTLMQAYTQQKVIRDNVADYLKRFRDRQDHFSGLKTETAEQIGAYKQQIADFRAQSSKSPMEKNLIQQLNSLLETLTAKEKKIDGMIGFFKEWTDRFAALDAEVNLLATRYEDTIAKRAKRRILNQETSPLVRIAQGELAVNAREMVEKTDFMASRGFWSKPEEVSWEHYGVFLFTFLFFFAMTEGLLHLASRYCSGSRKCQSDLPVFWQNLTLTLVQRTLLLAGAIAFFHYFPVRPIYRLTPAFVLVPLAMRILFVFLALQWGLVFLRAMREHGGDPLVARLYPFLRKLLIGIAVYGTGYFVIGRLYCEECILLIAWRLVFELGLVVWAAAFLHIFRRHASESKLSGNRWFEMSRPFIVILGYMAVLVGLLAELTGFGGFAAHWYLGIGRTALVLMWSVILYGVLGEFDTASATEEVEEHEAQGEQPYPIRWLLVRLLRLAFAFVVIFALPMAWGAERTFLADLFYAINYRIDIGNIQLSVMGLFYAVVVLLIVHFLSVIWKSLLRNKILKDSKIDKGLKDSITRITGYGLWTIGILIALRMIGISGTSLTVIFGAVSIGLGFGLQNIFNNFVSGIILLFERPIQIGDVIEIDGIWGTVREINVRSTHVRTYDNADLIIPNSDFISQRLTNWSFHDARVRRKIVVGVAYGSDIHQVRDTLLNIALKNARVLRRPKPQVVFTDFGDSALIFELRIWCHIDTFMEIETEIRFEIDKQFRTLNISIPFPQRDIYIHDMSSVKKKEDTEAPLTAPGVSLAVAGEG